MELLRASELADRLSLSRRRFSQLVSEGKSDGCYEVDTQVRRVLQKEITEVETMLRLAAQRIADDLAVDMKSVRSIPSDAARRARQGPGGDGGWDGVHRRRVLSLYRLLHPTRAQRGYATVLLQIELP